MISKKLKNPKIINSLFVAVGLGVGFFLAKFYFIKPTSPSQQIITVRQTGPFKFINPLLLVDISDTKDFIELKSFGNKINDLVNKKKSENKAVDIGVYFRDYNTGHWTGVNENNKFYPASLMKLPLMVAYFKQAMEDPSILNKKLLYDGKSDLNKREITKPENPIKPEQSYSVKDLIKAMIIGSDNNATNLLSQNIDHHSFNEIYTDLSQAIPDSAQLGNADYLSPKQYSTYLRVLRNSTYLSREYSEEALNIMSQAEFKKGISAGLPEGTLVAHKFGEFIASDSITGQTYNELHDCGIVYIPQNNYLLCIMTKGLNRQDLEQNLNDISALVYNEVTSGYK